MPIELLIAGSVFLAGFLGRSLYRSMTESQADSDDTARQRRALWALAVSASVFVLVGATLVWALATFPLAAS